MADSSVVDLDEDNRVDPRPRDAELDRGSSLIEQMIAMTVIMAVLLGLLGALGATAQSLNSGRQRTLAVSLAKQAIETLQGAAYANVAMNLASPGLSSDPLVSGTAPNQKFVDGDPATPDELLVPGGTAEYRQTSTTAGTTFSLRTFVTAVPPSATGYRRITVIVDWNLTGATSAAGQRSLRFSSLVFPLDYRSYPSSSGSAEATGGSVTVVGHLGGDTFEDLHLSLPGARATTNSSTLRTAIGTAAGSTSVVDVQGGELTSAACSVDDASASGVCPRSTSDSVADNDQGTTTGSWVSDVGHAFTGGAIATSGVVSVSTPSGTMTSRASSDACGSCGFGDGDGLPWAQASAATTTWSRITFHSDHGAGPLLGSLWELDNSSSPAGNPWAPTATVDHDATSGGIVSVSAQLVTPATKLLVLDPSVVGAPTGFGGAVKVGGFTAIASAPAGATTVAPTTTSGAVTVQLWEQQAGLPGAYRTIVVNPGTNRDETASATFTVGAHALAISSRVQAQPGTTSVTGSAPRADAAAHMPSLLLVTLTVDVSTVPLTPEEAPQITDSFTVTFDYGGVSGHSTWLVEPPA